VPTPPVGGGAISCLDLDACMMLTLTCSQGDKSVCVQSATSRCLFLHASKQHWGRHEPTKAGQQLVRQDSIEVQSVTSVNVGLFCHALLC
jgi:hypothetical protein